MLEMRCGSYHGLTFGSIIFYNLLVSIPYIYSAYVYVLVSDGVRAYSTTSIPKQKRNVKSSNAEADCTTILEVTPSLRAL
jgi:hypothetical protein